MCAWQAGRTREEALEIYAHLVSSTTTAAKAVRERWTEVSSLPYLSFYICTYVNVI
jgi:hypothetical protein